jgi:hypothetical protein
VEAERQLLGETIPFLTQYRLLPVHGGGGFLSAVQKAQLQGAHSRQRQPEPGKIYVGGLDLAGEAENEEKDRLKGLNTRQDSAVFTIGEVRILPRILPILPMSNTTNNSIPIPASPESFLTSIRIVEHYAWTGWKNPDLLPQRGPDPERQAAAERGGRLYRIGQPVASSCGGGVRVGSSLHFHRSGESEQVFNAGGGQLGGLKMYAADSSRENKVFWHQMKGPGDITPTKL